MVELRQVSKRYPNGTLANDTVGLSVRRGEIHAIVGENGAGKSTVMKMLYGLEQPSAGQILLDGRPVAFRRPSEAIAAGIGLVPQHLELVPSFSVAQNVVLGCEPTRGPLLDRARAVDSVAAIAKRYGLAVDPHAIVGRLSVGEQQRVEILKALYRGARVLLLDEPSALLSPQEADALFAALRGLVAQGLTVILISHKMSEVRTVSDRFTVMRAGKVAGRGVSQEIAPGDIAEMIVGRKLGTIQVSRQKKTGAKPLVSARALGWVAPGGRAQLRDVAFDIAAGEILGIAGVEGNGQGPLARILGGIEPPTTGHATLNEAVFTGQGVRAARSRRVAAIPEDRLHDGVALNMSIVENAIAADYHQRPLSRWGWINTKAARDETALMIQRYGVVAQSPEMPIASLSGGNMQKVVLGREVSSRPAFLVASQPTRGVDIGAAQALRQHLVDLRDQGAAILLISADLDEILDLSDRIAVLYQGAIVGHFPADHVSAQELGLYMTGLRSDAGAAALLDSAFTASVEEPAA
ncbi:MAG TPA: ABC transporter ATP-binding protein [Albitalea sp.]|nr:ABC transporter ATP-binding protein [Albitalea sp.]